MSNSDMKEAWHYHDGTKHPDGHLMDRWHFFDQTNQPIPFKTYTDLKPITLTFDKSPIGISALAAVSTVIIPSSEERIPDINTLARILYFSAGITKKIRSGFWGEMEFRAASCTGALYHIELYVVCGELPGLEAGIYHFNPHDFSLRQLRKGDCRHILIKASGNETSMAKAPAILAYTDIFWHNSCKYQAREYRHAFWDCGTILSHTLAISAVHGLPAKVVAGFVDESVNRLLGLDIKKEVSLALVPIGHTTKTAEPLPDIGPLSLETSLMSENGIDFPAIREMHAASSLADGKEAASWRGKSPQTPTKTISGQLFPLHPHTKDEMSQNSPELVIIRRGSTRKFSHEPITLLELSMILNRATQGVPADFLEPFGTSLNQAYLIVNAVDGIPSGAYVFHRDRQAVEILKEGDFRHEAGYLGLNQTLPHDASVDIFFLADLKPILERFGNRGYRAAQLDAAITAGRIYLAAYAQGIGATGLTFYDDAVTDFFSLHAKGKSVMFLMAIGKKAKRA